MKAISWILAILPPLLLLATLATLAFVESESIGNLVAWIWIGCSVGCLGWGIFIFRRFRKLALACLAVGAFNVVLVILLPIVAYLRMTHRI
jgi:hypothetical protein